MTIAVPADRVEQEIRQRLASLAKTAKIAGFRPGKVPVSVMERHYGDKVRLDVVNELMNSTFNEAVTKERLRPVGVPTIESQRNDPGKDLEYTAVFEVYPEIQFNALEGLAVDKPTAEIGERDIDAMLERMRQQRPDYREVDRPARTGDQVLVDLGRDDGQPGEGHQLPIVIGSKSVMEDFEEALVGVKAGEAKTIEIEFPSDYRDPQYAGRPVVFHIKAMKVSEPVIPQVDEAFARGCGIEEGGVEALRREVAQSMRKEADEASREIVKRNVLNRLREANPVEVPKTLLDEELKRLAGESRQGPAGQDAQGQGAVVANRQLEEKAGRRVALGLMIAEIVKQQNIQVKPEALRAKVEAVASTYDEPHKIVEWYYADRRRLRQLESLVLEDEVVEWLLARAQVREQPTTYEALMERRQETG